MGDSVEVLGTFEQEYDKVLFRHLIITVILISCIMSSLYFHRCFHLTEPFGSSYYRGKLGVIPILK